MQDNNVTKLSDADAVSQATLMRIVATLALAAMLLTFQSQLFAPLFPAFMREFGVSADTVGTLVPLYMVCYGLSSLIYGPLSDAIGRRRVILILLLGEITVMALTAGVSTFTQLKWLRAASGLCSGGIIPIILALVGDRFPFHRRGRIIGWIFSACSAGTALGSSLGVLLNTYVGWRIECAGLAAANVCVAWWVFRLMGDAPRPVAATPNVENLSLWRLVGRYAALLCMPRALLTYLYVFTNAVFHYGLYAWLGLYFSRVFALEDRGIGLALIGYGVMGMFLGPSIGRMADRYGRHWMLTVAFGLAALCALALAFPQPLWLAAVVVTLLSFSYDLSYPPLVGIVTNLAPKWRGQAMGLNTLVLYCGFGLGSDWFQRLITAQGLTQAFFIFAAGQFMMTIGAWFAFADQ